MSTEIDEGAYCSQCGAELEAEDCWDCQGEGGWDRYEDDPIQFLSDAWEECEECQGTGVRQYCPNGKSHQEPA